MGRESRDIDFLASSRTVRLFPNSLIALSTMSAEASCLFDSPPKPDALLILVPLVLVLLTSPALLLTVTVLVLLTSPALLLTPERFPASAAVPPPSESATSPAKSALISP